MSARLLRYRKSSVRTSGKTKSVEAMRAAWRTYSRAMGWGTSMADSCSKQMESQTKPGLW